MQSAVYHNKAELHREQERMARVELLVARQEVLMGQLREAVVRCEYIRLQIEEAQQELQALTDETKKIK